VWFFFRYLEGLECFGTIIYSPPSSWQDVIGMGCRSWKLKSMVDVLSRLILSSTVYNLWCAKNELKYKGQQKTKEQVLNVIVWEIHSRILGKGRFKKAREKLENFNLSQNRNLNINVLI
jgi:hypothetical protein